MCYHETLEFLTCTHKVKTTSLCPSYLRHEYKVLGPNKARRTGEGIAYLPYAECRNLVKERYVVVAFCPECNEEARKGCEEEANKNGHGHATDALERSGYIEYHLGRDAWYTEEGKDGMGNRRWRRRGLGNGWLRRRTIVGVTWSFDDGGYGQGREERAERYEEPGERYQDRGESYDRRYDGRGERYRERGESSDRRYDGRMEREEERYGTDERYYDGGGQYHDGSGRYEEGGYVEEKRHRMEERYYGGESQYYDHYESHDRDGRY